MELRDQLIKIINDISAECHEIDSKIVIYPYFFQCKVLFDFIAKNYQGFDDGNTFGIEIYKDYFIINISDLCENIDIEPIPPELIGGFE